MKIAIIGKGNVGKALGGHWTKAGHDLKYGVPEPVEQDEESVVEAVSGAEVVVFAVPYAAYSEEFFAPLDLAGKVVIDAVNPIASDFSELDWKGNHSTAEVVSKFAPSARVVKAFNTVGFNITENPDFGGTSATMLVAGDDVEAKKIVMSLAEECGFSPEDAGALIQARYLEAFAWVWIAMAAKYGHGRDMAFVLHKR